MKNTSKWIGLKDVILVTLLTAVFLVIITVAIIPFSANLKLVLLIVSGIELLLCGPVYVLMCAKAPRHGTLLLFATLLAIYYYLTNSMILISLIIFGVGIVMELLTLNQGYRSPVRLTIAYALLGVGIMLAPITLMYINKPSMVAQMEAAGLTQDYIDSVFSVYSAQNILIGVVVTILGAIIGFVIGYKMQKKHFAPAGVVDAAR